MTLQVFISYKSEYRDFAREVKNELGQWGYQSWLDVDNIQPGDYFRHKIQEGLDSSDILLMVLTEEAQLSREVMAEVDYFLDIARKPVVPLRHRDCKPLYIFVSIQYIDFVADQANGFVRLKQRLAELAASLPAPQTASQPAGGLVQPLAPTSPITPSRPPEPQPIETAKEESEKKREVLDDGLFDFEQADNKPLPKPPAASMPPPLPSPITQPQRQPAASQGARKSGSPLLWPVGALAGFIIVVGAVLLLSSNATPAPQSSTSPLPTIGIAAIIALTAAIGFILWRRSPQPAFGAAPGTSTTDDRKPSELAQEPDAHLWLEDVLAPDEQPDELYGGQSTVPHVILRHSDYGDYPLPSDTAISTIFNDLNGELLLLGSPEDDKKLLAQLWRELGALTRQGLSSSIPVIFNVASWKADSPLADWLTGELNRRFGANVAPAMTASWIHDQTLVPLFEGLDALNEAQRQTYLDALNAFRRQFPKVDFALCSHPELFSTLTARLDVRAAVVIAP